MVVSIGLQNTFILIAALGVVFWSGCLAWIAVGKSMRKSTAASYWKLVEKFGLSAH